MESFSRYGPPNNKKMVFPGGSSSSSSGFKDVEIPPPINRTANPKPYKQKEVVRYEVIDVDMEEDCDLMLIDAKVNGSGKGKEALTDFSAGFSSFTNDGSPSTFDDFNSNLYYGENQWLNTYYDDLIFDDDSYAAFLESQFDHMDLPPGIEAPFPGLPTSPQNNKKVLESTSTNTTSQLQPNHNNLSPRTEKRDHKSSSTHLKIDLKISRKYRIGPTPSKLLGSLGMNQYTSSSSKAHLSPQYSKGKEPLPPFGKTKKRSFGPHVYSGPHNQFPSGGTNLSSDPYFNGTGAVMPVWQDLMPMHMVEPSMGVVMHETSRQWEKELANSKSGGLSIERSNVDKTGQNMVVFKNFDTVEDYSDHHFAKYGSSAKQPPKNWAKRIQDEWKSLEKDLPDTIFVRVYESRMDILRAVIIGAEGTPYHDGLFFFDVFFPNTYPNTPPQVHYHSGGLRINPNLYNCGKVCLSLLNTWSGSPKEMWTPGVSTMLQVLVSIQGLILNAKPFFNEPGYSSMRGSANGEKRSLEYNESTFIHSLRTMVYTMKRPPKKNLRDL